MKLNKVMALALSGLMAVSMLAGCSNGTPNGEENNEGQNTTTNAVSVMNEAQDTVEFAVNSNFEAALNAAKAKVAYGDIKSLTFDVKGSGDDSVYNAMKDKLANAEGLTTSKLTFAAPAKPGDITTKTVIYKVESEGLSEEAALKAVAKAMDMDKYPTVVYIGSAQARYEANYTGSVSIVNVTASDAGETASAYYIAVQVTQSVARDAIVTG